MIAGELQREGTAMELLSASSPEEAVRSLYGRDTFIKSTQPVSGGDINEACCLTLSTGTRLFCKRNRRRGASFFQAEAEGLAALRSPGVIGVPRPLALGEAASGRDAFLLLEWMQPGRKIRGYWETFGHELAALHRADCSSFTAPGAPFGFRHDNYIGATPQKNTPCGRWSDFFRDCRLMPQLQAAGRWFDPALRRAASRLMDRIGDLLPEPEFPSLLHGDLWGGNCDCGPDGKVWIYDPAVYAGHHEAELAMTELFGSLPSAFYGAYHEVIPALSGYGERRDLYNLYHLLNHLNLFGGAWYGSVRSIILRFGR